MSDSTHTADHAKDTSAQSGGQGFSKGGAAAVHGGPAANGKTDNSGHPKENEGHPAGPATPAHMPAAPAKLDKNQVIVLPFLPDFTIQQWIDTLQAVICLAMILIGMNDYGKQPLWLAGMGPLIFLLIREDDPKWKLTIEAICIAGIGGAYAIFNVDAGLIMAAIVGCWNGIDIIVWLLRTVADILHWVSKGKHGLAKLGK